MEYIRNQHLYQAGDGRKVGEKEARGGKKKAEGRRAMDEGLPQRGNKSTRGHEAHCGYRELPACCGLNPVQILPTGADYLLRARLGGAP